MSPDIYDKNCRSCPRLAAFLDDVNERYPDYYCKPVPPFGDGFDVPDRRARTRHARRESHGPAVHGRSRRYPALSDAAQVWICLAAESLAADDDLRMTGCRITNAVKCLPPDNKPVGAEINTCNSFLANELQSLPEASLVLALGGIAHRAVVKALGGRQADFKFAHAAVHDLGDFDARFVPLQSLQHEHATPDDRNVRRGICAGAGVAG